MVKFEHRKCTRIESVGCRPPMICINDEGASEPHAECFAVEQ